MSDTTQTIELAAEAVRSMNKANHKTNAELAHTLVDDVISNDSVRVCPTIRHAIESLIDELEQNARMGSASFITAPKVERIVEALSRLQ